MLRTRFTTRVTTAVVSRFAALVRARRSLAALTLGALTLAPLAAQASAAFDLVGGPAVRHDRVEAFATDVWNLRFLGERSASVIVDGDGDTDLDCYVYDEHDNLIASDDDLTDYCVLRWTPRWTGPFRLEIHNLGDVYNAYELRTN